jgi:hypothetical protein
MYRHKVQYRHRTPERNLSAVKELEFDLDKELYYDGPGAWRDICRNMIANKTGLNKSDIMNDDNLRFTCKGKINIKSSSTPPNSSNNSNNTSRNSNNKRATNNESSDKPESSTSYYEAEVDDGWRPHPDMPDNITVITPSNRFLYSDKSDYWAKHPQGKSNQKKLKQFFARLEAEEDQQRKDRIAKLKSNGHGLQAFFLEFKSGILATGAVLGLLIVFLFIFRQDAAVKKDAMQIHAELELLEDSVNLCILNNQFDEAFVLTNKLNHPMHEDMEQMEFDAWNGYPKFDEYWTKKREEYKKIIFNKGSLNSKQDNTEKHKVEKKEQQEEESPIENNEPIHNENEGIDNQDGLDDEYKN